MANLFLIVLAHVTVTVVVMLLWLVRTHMKLKGELQVLKNSVQKNDQYLAGLSSSARAADSRLAFIDEQLKGLSAKLSAFQQNEQSANPYNAIIQKIRHGASVEELMRDCSLCRDEAVLLMRLHGSGPG
ncbi:DUF2802 domain-containing protein [Methylomicrobium agile]|uniref:DUF2802 domain-containing protein n=1 Tax=Methylomicrobium agile TaxID=39774 RepID=UPI0004DFAC47|nr:DUF2802 domain-containing protein [Methylomicrobium agile]